MMRQAVILAGGLGTRLRPMTDTIPKPMAPIDGEPFLSILLRQLSRYGISEVLVLAGYLSDVIVDGISEITPDDMSVKVLPTDSELVEGERLLHAERNLDSTFLLLYGDNLADVRLVDVSSLAADKRKSVLSIYSKVPGNVEFESATSRLRYLDGNRSDSAGYVEVGYGVIRKTDLIDVLKNETDLKRAYAKLSKAGSLLGIAVAHPYFSVSDISRLAKLENAVRNTKVLFLDRDGVINRKPPRWSYVTSPDELEFIDDSIDAMKRLAGEGFEFVIASNQAGVGRGVMSQSDLESVNHAAVSFLSAEGITVLGVYSCPHDWERNCSCRKPQPGLLFEAAGDIGLFLEGLFMVGDSVSDVFAAKNAGMRSALLSPGTDSSGVSDILGDRFTRIVDPLIEHYVSLELILPPRFGVGGAR